MNAVSEMLGEVLADEGGYHCRVQSIRPLTGGAAAQIFAVDALLDGEPAPLILRCGDETSQFGNALQKRQEAEVIRAAFAAGLPVPEVLAITPACGDVGAGFVMRRLGGESLPKRILTLPELATARERLARQCGEVLARLHAMPIAGLPLPRFSVAEDLARYRQRYREFDEPIPIFELAFAWLAANPPRSRPPAPVHGDFRNGNILVDEQGLSGVLDWELAHIGNPVEDLGWLCVNSWRFAQVDQPVGGFGSKADLLTAYNTGQATPVTDDELAYWEIFGVLKWGVLCLYQCAVHLSGQQVSVERAAIGRRISECEVDLIRLIEERT